MSPEFKTTAQVCGYTVVAFVSLVVMIVAAKWLVSAVL